MWYRMPLSIVGVNGTAIDVVNGPVALRHGGASPVPRVVLHYIACSLGIAK